MEEGLERVDHWGAGEYAFDSSVLRDLPAAVPSEAMDRGALTSPACLSRFLETYTYTYRGTAPQELYPPIVALERTSTTVRRGKGPNLRAMWRM